MPDILPDDLELRDRKSFRTGPLAALGDIAIGFAAECGLCVMIGHPPFGAGMANPSVWTLLPIAVGARHGEIAGFAAGLVAWGGHHMGRLWTDRATPLSVNEAIMGFMFVLCGALVGYLTGAIRTIATEELSKHRIARDAIRKANSTLRMGARARDELVQELMRTRAAGSAVAPQIRRVLLAEPARLVEELLEYIDSIHEVRCAAVYRREGTEWTLVASRGAHPDGEFQEILSRGKAMATASFRSGEAIFCENPLAETGVPLIVAPFQVSEKGVESVVIVEDLAYERLSSREMLAIATVVEFFGIAHSSNDAPDGGFPGLGWRFRRPSRSRDVNPGLNRISAILERLVMLRRIIGTPSSLVIFPETDAGEEGADRLAARITGAITGRWEAAGRAHALLAPGMNTDAIQAIIAEIFPHEPELIRLVESMDAAPDSILFIDEWGAMLAAATASARQ